MGEMRYSKSSNRERGALSASQCQRRMLGWVIQKWEDRDREREREKRERDPTSLSPPMGVCVVEEVCTFSMMKHKRENVSALSINNNTNDDDDA